MAPHAGPGRGPPPPRGEAVRSFPGGPRLRVAFLVAVAVGVFFLPAWWMVAAAGAAMSAAWLALGLGAGRLGRQVRKLLPICLLFVAGFALFAADPARDTWWLVNVGVGTLELNGHGALLGVAMALRIVTVVIASHVARAGDPRALAAGFRKVGMPRLAAAAIDATLVLLEGGRGRGGGGGGGGGGGAPAAGRGLAPGEALYPGQAIQSAGGAASLVYQDDGNLVVYRADGTPVWASHTAGTAPGDLVMQWDGNLVLYDAGGRALWASQTHGHDRARLVLQDDGVLVVYAEDGAPLWSTAW